MKKKYTQQIRNLVLATEFNKQMSGDKLRDKINLIFINYSREKLGLINTLALTGQRSSEVLKLKKAGA